jgi:DNA-binding FadR family transcriptional regulator
MSGANAMPADIDLDRKRSDPGLGRLSGAIYEKIFTAIVSGEFSLNDRLPSETVLSQRFEASRPVVREALARLREDGIIVSRKGSGSYVLRRPDHAVLRFAPVGSLADIQLCFEFRSEVEGAAAAVAAERRQPADLAAIKHAYQALDTCIAEGRLGVDEDIRFHTAVAEATRNQYYASVQIGLQSHIARGMTVMRSLSLLRPAARLLQVQAEHLAIVAAIEARDADGARLAMKTHIVNARHRMFDGSGKTE